MLDPLSRAACLPELLSSCQLTWAPLKSKTEKERFIQNTQNSKPLVPPSLNDTGSAENHISHSRKDLIHTH